jgi:hypothetical protein
VRKQNHVQNAFAILSTPTDGSCKTCVAACANRCTRVVFPAPLKEKASKCQCESNVSEMMARFKGAPMLPSTATMRPSDFTSDIAKDEETNKKIKTHAQEKENWQKKKKKIKEQNNTASQCQIQKKTKFDLMFCVCVLDDESRNQILI